MILSRSIASSRALTRRKQVTLDLRYTQQKLSYHRTLICLRERCSSPPAKSAQNTKSRRFTVLGHARYFLTSRLRSSSFPANAGTPLLQGEVPHECVRADAARDRTGAGQDKRAADTSLVGFTVLCDFKILDLLAPSHVAAFHARRRNISRLFALRRPSSLRPRAMEDEGQLLPREAGDGTGYLGNSRCFETREAAADCLTLPTSEFDFIKLQLEK